MKHAKFLITLAPVLVLAFVIATPLLTTPADAAAVLQSPSAAAANLGESFEIVARGRAGVQPDQDGTFEVTLSTQMNLEFTIEERATQGVLLSTTQGEIILNDTVFVFDEGVGFAARPEAEALNVTVVFGFRINMTGPNGETAELVLLGGVKRTQRVGPVLIMRGRLVVGETVFVLGQLGRIYRV
jgi:hypothetical protein